MRAVLRPAQHRRWGKALATGDTAEQIGSVESSRVTFEQHGSSWMATRSGGIVWSPLAQGVLTGKYKPGEQPPAGSRATDQKGGADMIKRWLQDDVLERVQRLEPVADEAGLTLAQMAVAWVLQNDNVSAAIIGASRPEQVTDNVKASGVRLDEATMRSIDTIVDPIVERDAAKTRSPTRREF